MKRLTDIVLVCLIASCVCVACSDRSGEFGQFVELNPSGWVYDDTVSILPTDVDSATDKQVVVAVRHNNDFLYRNLWLELSMTDTVGRVTADTVNIELADVYGRWLGKGLGSSYQGEKQVAHPVNIAAGSDVKIRHIMRVDTLRGIEQVGIIVKDL